MRRRFYKNNRRKSYIYICFLVFHIKKHIFCGLLELGWQIMEFSMTQFHTKN